MVSIRCVNRLPLPPMKAATEKKTPNEEEKKTIGKENNQLTSGRINERGKPLCPERIFTVTMEFSKPEIDGNAK